MGLPRGDEYQSAIQNPQLCFADAELKSCVVETTPLGLPRPYSGGFTTTYHLSGGNKDWAVRCFTKEIPELQRRYTAIGRFLDMASATPFVRATCLPQGIRIGAGDSWHPIIKMQWVEGDPLNLYISKHSSNRTVLSDLTLKFAQLVSDLERLRVAHGDLQHGNIIVTRGQLKLIDYDGLFVDELSSLKTHEIGHVNYQHPLRTSSQYSPTIDRFSSVVIYLGLRAVALRPMLWTRYDNSENILFRSDDFSSVETSPLLRDLASLPDLSALVQRFKYICKADLDQVPRLSEFISGAYVSPAASRSIESVRARTSQYPIIDAWNGDGLSQLIGARAEVIGRIDSYHWGTSRRNQPYLFLNVGAFPRQAVTLVFWSDALQQCQQRDLGPESFINTFINKWVSITGVISTYEDRPQIVIDMPSQIQVLPNEVEARRRLAPLYPEGVDDSSRQSARTADSARTDVQQGSTASSVPKLTPLRTGTIASPQIGATPVRQTPALGADTLTTQQADVLNQLYGKNMSVSRSQPGRAPARLPVIPPQQPGANAVGGGTSQQTTSGPQSIHHQATPVERTSKVPTFFKNHILLILVLLGLSFLICILYILTALSPGSSSNRSVPDTNLDGRVVLPTQPSSPAGRTPLVTVGTDEVHAIVSSQALNMRSGPSTDYVVVHGCKEGDELNVVARSDNGKWLKVTHDGKECSDPLKLDNRLSSV